MIKTIATDIACLFSVAFFLLTLNSCTSTKIISNDESLTINYIEPEYESTVEIDGITWFCDYKQAQVHSKQTGKSILVFFYTTWCPYCTKMEEVFTSQKIIKLFDDYVLLRLNPEKTNNYPKKIKTEHYPTFYLLNNEKIIKKHSGFMNIDSFYKFIVFDAQTK